MASSKEYLNFILEQLSELEDITYRTMMGEYITYYHGKIIGGVYDDRFLVKPVKSAIEYMGNAKYELPYDGDPSYCEFWKGSLQWMSFNHRK